MTRGLGILALGMVLTGMAGLAWADNYSTRVLADNPYGYWRLDESGGLTAVNLGSGGAAINGNYGQFSPPDGIPTLGVPGIPGAPTDTAAGFHGTAPVSQVYVPDAVNPSAYSLESWVKANPGATTGRNIMVRTAGNPTTTYSHQLLILGDGRLRHYGYSSTGGKWLDSASPVQANQWYHVVGTASQGTGPTDGHWTLYVNGHLQNEWFGDVGTLWNGGTQWRIGSVAGGGADWFDGTIDETALYHDELGPRQIRQHYMAGMGISPVYENPSRRMTAGDFDNDGVNEVAYIGSTNHIWVQDFNNPAASGVLPGPTVRALTAADLDGNGVPEIAFIDASANQLRSYNAVTGTLTTHSLPAGYTAFSTLSAGDVDGQVGHELMLSANADQLFIYENGTYVDTGGQANRIARGEVVQGTAGDDFLVISAGGDPYVYNRASNSFAGLGGNISYAAIGNLVTSDAGDEVLASNSAGNLYLNNGGWTYTNGSVPVLPGLGLGHLDPGLPPNQDLAYVIGAGNIVYQSQTNWSAANGGSTAYVFLPRVPSAGSPILVTGNRGFGDILVADINNDGLEELVLRKAGGDTNALYVFKNGDPGFSLAAAPDPASNYAGGKPAISGSGAYNGVPFDQGSFPASRVTDGKFGDNSADSFWLGSDGQPNQYITIDLEAQVPIELIGLRNTHNAQYNDRGTKSFRIWASNQVDAGNQLVSPVLILDSQLQAFTGPAGDRRIPAQLFTSGNGLTPGAYRYIRFETHDDSAFGNGNVGLNEIYVSGVRNMALGEPIVKADVYGAGFDAERVTDGKVIDSFQDSYWLGPEGNANASFTLDLGVSRDIKSLAFRNTHNANFNDRGTRQFAVYGSNQIDGSSNLVNPQLVLQGALTTSRGTAGDPWVPVDVFNLQTGVNGGRYRYLRFDALNASFNNSNVGLGEIQVFEDLLPANVAAGKPVTASSWLNNDFRPENITDLRIDDFRNNAGDVWDNNRNGTFASYWLAPDGATDQWLQIDLGHLYRIDRIDLQNTHNGRYNDRATRDFRLEASEDGVNFWPVMTGTLADVRDPAGVGPTSPDIPLESFSAANGDFHRFAAQYLRFTAENFYGTGAGLNEIYAFSGVPEPGTIVLLGVGLAGLALAARRRWRVRRAGQE